MKKYNKFIMVLDIENLFKNNQELLEDYRSNKNNANSVVF